MKQLLILLINIYQLFISPILKIALGNSCRHFPTCSEYAKKVIIEKGVLKGLAFAVQRIVSCNPWVDSKKSYE